MDALRARLRRVQLALQQIDRLSFNGPYHLAWADVLGMSDVSYATTTQRLSNDLTINKGTGTLILIIEQKGCD